MPRASDAGEAVGSEAPGSQRRDLGRRLAQAAPGHSGSRTDLSNMPAGRGDARRSHRSARARRIVRAIQPAAALPLLPLEEDGASRWWLWESAGDRKRSTSKRVGGGAGGFQGSHINPTR